MIPKIIHYCWFGGSEKPNDIKNYIAKWHDILSDYEIIEWNETNFDVNCNVYARDAYNKKKWAFVSDYARLKVLHEYGGIYLDTDVEVFKTFQPLLHHKMFLGFMYDCNLGTAVIGSDKNNEILKELILQYDNKEVRDSPNNDLFTKFFLDKYSEFRLNGKCHKLGNEVVIYPKEYFERYSFNGKKKFTIHHYKGSWQNRKDGFIKRIIKKLMGKVLFDKVAHYRAVRMSPFFDIYKKHK